MITSYFKPKAKRGRPKKRANIASDVIRFTRKNKRNKDLSSQNQPEPAKNPPPTSPPKTVKKDTISKGNLIRRLREKQDSVENTLPVSI